MSTKKRLTIVAVVISVALVLLLGFTLFSRWWLEYQISLADEKGLPPLTAQQQRLFLGNDELLNTPELPAEWRDLQDPPDPSQNVFLESFSCGDGTLDYVTWYGTEQRHKLASFVGPHLMQLIRVVDEEPAREAISKMKNTVIPGCIKKQPVTYKISPTEEHRYELVDTSSIPDSVMWKITTTSTEVPDYLKVDYVGAQLKDDALVVFVWGGNPTMNEATVPEVVIDAMTKVAAK